MDHKIRVLLVDDNHSQREAVEAVLEDEFDVTPVRSAQEALTRLEREIFDVVVTDWQMPGMDGVQLVRTLRSKNAPVACVIVTGQMELLRAEIKLDVSDGVAALRKGDDPARLISLVKRLGSMVQVRHRMERIPERS